MPQRGSSLENKKKIEILEKIAKEESRGINVNFTAICKKFDVDRTTVSRIAKSRESLKTQS